MRECVHTPNPEGGRAGGGQGRHEPRLVLLAPVEPRLSIKACGGYGDKQPYYSVLTASVPATEQGKCFLH